MANSKIAEYSGLTALVVLLGAAQLHAGNISTKAGLLGTYRNLDCNHPDAGTLITGVVTGLVDSTLPLRLTPKATEPHSWGQYIYQFDWFSLPVSFQRADALLDWPFSWFPVDEGLCGDPYFFSVHWEALFWVPKDGDYQFQMGSDDDSWLFIDGILRFDLGGIHGYNLSSGSVYLTEGPHSLDIYFAERQTVESGIRFIFPHVTVLPVNSLVTGGGWIDGERLGPRYRRIFGFNAHHEPELTWGSFQYKDPALKMRAHSNTIVALAQELNTARFSGGCLVDGEPGYYFICTVEDNGEPGRNVDHFKLDITGPSLFSYHAEGSLGGGNIQIHESKPSDRSICLVSETEAAELCIQILPNPFRSETQISLSLPGHDHATVEIYDACGRRIDVLLDEEKSPGIHTVTWEPEVPAGMYFCRIKAGDFADTERIVLLR